MSDRPARHEQVEVEWNGRWLKATFHPADYIPGGEDEVWWMDHFVIDDDDEDTPLTLPEDNHKEEPLPPWRRLK